MKLSLPVHPVTGVRALGIVGGRAVWPIAGGRGLKSAALQHEALEVLGKAKAIAETAEKAAREMTGDELAEYRKHFERAQQLVEERKSALADEQVLADAKSLSDELGLIDASADLDAQGNDAGLARKAAMSLGRAFISSAEFKAALAPYKGRPVPEKARVQSDPVSFTSLIAQGSKALFTGDSSTSAGAFVVTERSDIVETLGRRDLTIRDIISVRRTGSDLVEYVAQTSHTNAAAPVAEATSSAAPTTGASSGAVLTLNAGGGYKPEGSWAFEVKQAAVKTIAEWVPVTKRALADVAALEGLINDELQADLAETEESQLISGDGTGENLTGVLNWSGTQTQAKGADTLFVAVRKALTKARTVGRVTPNAIVMNPAEVEKVDTAVDGQTRFYGNGPFGLGPRTLWGVPVVESEAMTAGTAVLGDWRKLVLWDREQATISMTDSHADFFIRNLVAILAEERVASALTRPTALVKVTGL